MNNIIRVSLAYLLFLSVSAVANATVVDCNAGDSLAAAVNAAVPGDTVSVSGVCRESIVITTNDIIIDGGKNTVITTPFRDAITVDAAVRVALSGLAVENAITAINGKSNASFSLDNITASNNVLGIHLQSGAHVKMQDVNVINSTALGINLSQGAKMEVVGLVQVSGSGAFGLNVQNNSIVRVDGSELHLSDNFLGGQIVVSSSLFINEGAVFANNNESLGLSINTGASAILFNATLDANNNGRDGLDAVSAANIDIDGTSTVNANNNGRDGISIDDGTINLFGFFVGENPGPKIIANNNAGNGVLVEFGGKLDIGINSSIDAKDNIAAGVAIDNGSIVQLQSSVITGNGGSLSKSISGDNENSERGQSKNIDVLATFGSRLTFLANNNIGKAVCDRSSISRGDVRCRR